MKGSEAARVAREYADSEMRKKLKNNPRLIEKMIPKNFNPGCRRPTPAPGYLEALVSENTTTFTDPIGSITETGFIDHEGNAHNVDVIICATGFNTSWLPRYPFIANGVDLRTLWGGPSGVTSYLSVGIPSFPNAFSFCGPYGPLGHGSFMPLIEQWTRYIFQCITKCQVEDIKSITPKMDAAQQFRQHADLFCSARLGRRRAGRGSSRARRMARLLFGPEAGCISSRSWSNRGSKTMRLSIGMRIGLRFSGMGSR